MEGDRLQIWRVAANMMKRQLQTADKGLSSSLGIGRGALKHLENSEVLHRASDVADSCE
jgi:uncharacterized protein (UPF0254 family)